MVSINTKRNKKIFSLAFFAAVFAFSFLFDVHPANAGLFSWLGDKAGEAFYFTINVVLYSVFILVSYPVTWAAMIFGLAVDPVAVDTMFKMPAIYTLWQMVRDFFNLFFILTLLFIAFATIFQIDSFNYKKTLGKLLLMALLVNFSFPISRFVIDVANVPMYFFMESIFDNPTQAKAQNIANVAFSTSGIQGVILPNINGYGDLKGDKILTTQILVGIIFMFLFGVSLFVLAILFLIRSLMLVILIIFSSVGFAGMVIPGFRSYATKWWDNLLKYAFFGPAAMLMVLVSVKFLQGFNAGVGNKASVVANNSGVGPADQVTYLASMVGVMAPIILIWISISIGQTMGIQGAGAVTANAQKFSKWAGRKTSGYDAAARRVKAYGSEREKRGNEKFAANNIGTKFGSWANNKLDKISASRTGQGSLLSEGALNKETAAARQARARYLQHQKEEVDKKTKEHMVGGNMSNTRLEELHEQARKDKDKTLLVATSRELSKKERGGDMNKLVTDADMQAIEKQFVGMAGIKNTVAEDTRDEVAKTNAAVAYGNNEAELTKAFASGKIKVEDQNGTALTKQLLVAANNTGKLDQKIVDELRKDTSKKMELDRNLAGAVADVEKQFQTTMADPSKSAEAKKESEKQRVRMQQSYFSHTGKFHETVDGTLTGTADMALQAEVFKKADAVTLKNVDKVAIGAYSAQIAQNMPIGKLVNAISELNESNTDLARNLASDIKGSGGSAAAGSREKIAYESLKNDRRTQGLMT